VRGVNQVLCPQTRFLIAPGPVDALRNTEDLVGMLDPSSLLDEEPHFQHQDCSQDDADSERNPERPAQRLSKYLLIHTQLTSPRGNLDPCGLVSDDDANEVVGECSSHLHRMASGHVAICIVRMRPLTFDTFASDFDANHV
jgi:hypothetical protein